MFLRGDDGGHARRLVVAVGQLEHAAAPPHEVVAVVLQRAEVLQRVQEGGPRGLRVHRVAQVGDGAHEADGGARALLVHVDEVHVPAPRGQPLGDHRAGEAGAHDDGAARPAVRRGRLPVAHAGEHLALVREALALLDAEPGVGERGAHAAGHGPGGERGAGHGQAREFAHHFGRPHVRVARRREAVEEERIGARLELRQQFARVARQERELHPPAVELQAVEAGDRRRPGRHERASRAAAAPRTAPGRRPGRPPGRGGSPPTRSAAAQARGDRFAARPRWPGSSGPARNPSRGW